MSSERDDHDWDDMTFEQVEEAIHRWLTPERKQAHLDWILMSVALKPEIELGSCPPED